MNTMESGVLASKLVLKSIFRVKNSCHTHLSIENSRNAVSRAKIVIQGRFYPRILITEPLGYHILILRPHLSQLPWVYWWFSFFNVLKMHSYSLHAHSGAKILIQVRVALLNLCPGPFLVADTRLYTLLCWLVCRSIRHIFELRVVFA